MAMEALVHARHIKVGGRFYVAQFFDRETGDVLAGPVPHAALDPAAGVLGRAARAPALHRLTREQYRLVYSHEAGTSKPDPRIYALICSRLNVRPGEMGFPR